MLEALTRAIRQKKKIKRIQRRKEINLFLFAYDMIQYLRGPKDSTKSLLELVNTFSKVLSHKINI